MPFLCLWILEIQNLTKWGDMFKLLLKLSNQIRHLCFPILANGEKCLHAFDTSLYSENTKYKPL